MNELESIDPVLHSQLVNKNVDYLACVLIRNEYGEPHGIFGATWPKTDIDISTRVSKIHDYLLEDKMIVRNLTK